MGDILYMIPVVKLEGPTTIRIGELFQLKILKGIIWTWRSRCERYQKQTNKKFLSKIPYMTDVML
jgi:hypothetical protein